MEWYETRGITVPAYARLHSVLMPTFNYRISRLISDAKQLYGTAAIEYLMDSGRGGHQKEKIFHLSPTVITHKTNNTRHSFVAINLQLAKERVHDK